MRDKIQHTMQHKKGQGDDDLRCHRKTKREAIVSVLYIVLPLALVFSGLAVGIFVWATQNGQFDDLDTPGMRMLQDDSPVSPAHRDNK